MLNTGLAQIDIRLGDRARNQEQVRAWMARCEPCPYPTVIVLPEMWDVGYALERKNELADDEGQEAALFLGGLARQYGVWFAGGSVLARTAGGIVNRAQVVDPAGSLVAQYDKIHLVPMMDEPLHLAGGDARCMFPIAGTTACLAVCYDLRFCELIRRYALDGARVLFVSAQWPAERVDHWISLLRARAIENMMYVVACNRVGTSGGVRFGGNSMTIDPWGVVLHQGSADVAEGAFVSFDPALADQIRNQLKVFAMRRPELY
ncbi:MAG: carbon-nitrogen family hydrolase [Deltaproteobacteria bacterium]|nr:carbon-nitrogen family hydrolase [Deltaproteobacteria bacterium]